MNHDNHDQCLLQKKAAFRALYLGWGAQKAGAPEATDSSWDDLLSARSELISF